MRQRWREANHFTPPQYLIPTRFPQPRIAGRVGVGITLGPILTCWKRSTTTARKTLHWRNGWDACFRPGEGKTGRLASGRLEERVWGLRPAVDGVRSPALPVSATIAEYNDTSPPTYLRAASWGLPRPQTGDCGARDLASRVIAGRRGYGEEIGGAFGQALDRRRGSLGQRILHARLFASSLVPKGRRVRSFY